MHAKGVVFVWHRDSYPFPDQWGASICLDQGTTSLGRKSFSGISVLDPDVSRNHCVITGEADLYRIVDLNSLNGTYVNGRRVREQPLKEGDVIRIGSSQFLFQLRDEFWLRDNEESKMPNSDECFQGGRILLFTARPLPTAAKCFAPNYH